VGVVSCRLRGRLRWHVRAAIRSTVSFGPGLIALLGLAVVAGREARYGYQLTAALCGAFVLSFCVAEHSPLGKISDSGYLNHPSLVYALGSAYAAQYASEAGNHRPFLGRRTETLVVPILFSHVTFEFIEVPMMAAGKKFVAEWAWASDAPAAAH